MQTASEAYNAITERLRTYGLSNEQVVDVGRMLNAFWDAVDAEVHVNELPTD
jgi:hypothetical protein